MHFVMAAQGDMSTRVLDDTLAKDPGNFILVVEGTVPTRNNGLYCVIGTRGGKPLTALQAVRELGAAARYVVAAGTCAAFPNHYSHCLEYVTAGCPGPTWPHGRGTA